MTIMEALGGHNGETIMEALGGQKGETIVDVINSKEITIEDNPLNALAMDFDIPADTDLLGKYVDDLQSDMTIGVFNKVSGTSLYVTDYTGFSGIPSEQEGNYVAFHISVGDLVIGTNVTVKVNGVTMDPDGLHIMRFKDGSSAAKAKVVASAAGHDSVMKTFDFSKVVKEPEE